MNKKIEELAEQSGAINDADYWGDEYFVLKGQENIEKFAELIIQECSKICLDHNNWYEDAAGETFSALIKQKFEIKL